MATTAVAIITNEYPLKVKVKAGLNISKEIANRIILMLGAT